MDALIGEAIAESGATSIKEMGKAMALLKQKAQGRTDMGGSRAAKLANSQAVADVSSSHDLAFARFLLTYAGALLPAISFAPFLWPAASHNTSSTS